MTSSLSQEEFLRYSRHLLIPEVGVEGQRKLKDASILVVGTGGLGSPVSLYLAAAGIGHIGLVDYDVVDLSNLQRQIIHGTNRIGESKISSARERLWDLNPDIVVDAYNEPFTSSNARQIAQDYEIIVDCTDNFPTRYLTNDLCVLTGKPNVYGAIYRFDGQVSVFDAQRGPCYRCLFPEPPPPGLVPTCADGGVLGVLPGTIGTLQATEAIKLILGAGEPLIGRLLLYNALDMTFEYIKLRKNPICKVCSPHPKVTDLIDYEGFCGAPGYDHSASVAVDWEISAPELLKILKANRSVLLLDVREPHELEISRIEGARLIPLGQLSSRLSELDRREEIVVFCRTGSRSCYAVEILRNAGFVKVKNLKGGINAWAKETDPNIPVY
jgi:molybdopterin/thiamine biosynthesis adenylyltransferase/rhodanese-related sulfurtransferase